ncbi:MAG: NUDIX domain-containing protein [Bacteroidetes bacterium]|nr:NUDIX domain-containing protein [Bacteroidota bacterium]
MNAENMHIAIWHENTCLWLGDASALQSYDYIADEALAHLSTLQARHMTPATGASEVYVRVHCASRAEMQRVFETYQARFTPIHTGGGVVRRGQSLLCITRKGKWDLPKGKIDAGEDSLQAAIREVAEETGVADLQLQAPLPCTWHIYPEKGRLMLKTGWWYAFTTAYGGDLIPQAEEEITGVQWQPLASLRMETVNTYPAIRHLMRDYLRRFPVS